jgi:cell division cycle 14
LQGIQKARDVGFIDWNSGSSTWSLEEYEHYEQVRGVD